MTRPVVVRALERRFGDRVALAGVDLEVGPGEIVGLVGPNGSGKTTLLRTIAGFLRPHGGEVSVFGDTPFERQARVMERARFAFAPPALFESLTATEHLRHLGGLRTPSMPPVRPADIERTLEQVGLRERAHEPVRTFSFGMRQRLALAQALCPLPELLVLDEPTDGLDPVAVLELRGILARLRDEAGLAILLSNHLLIEIEELVDRMLVLIEGRCVFQGTPEAMTSAGRCLRLRAGPVDRVCEVLEGRGLKAVPAAREGWVELSDGAASLRQLQEVLAASGLELQELHEHAPSLEEVLLERLGRTSDTGEERA